MKAEIKGKTIPFEQIKTYYVSLKKHEKQIAGLIKYKEEGVLEIEDLEKRSPQLIFQIYEIITKIVMDNGIKQEYQQM